jgi:hypothetical protein
MTDFFFKNLKTSATLYAIERGDLAFCFMSGKMTFLTNLHRFNFLQVTIYTHDIGSIGPGGVVVWYRLRLTTGRLELWVVRSNHARV